MFGVLCARPRFWLLASLSISYAYGAAPFARLPRLPKVSSAAFPATTAASASVWHTILPSYWRRNQPTPVFRRFDTEMVKHGEGSWNVAWDARPARWLNNPDSAWLLFGVSPAAAAKDPEPDAKSEVLVATEEASIDRYRVIAVPADGRCLFRAIAHVACLRKGLEAPDEVQQQQLADELRAMVVEELIKRRNEIGWSVEGGDFDEYVKGMQLPHKWGGEHELIMCSHILSTRIHVFMREGSTGKFTNIAKYGEEYINEGEDPINVLFHGYGHYDILEPVSSSSR